MEKKHSTLYVKIEDNNIDKITRDIIEIVGKSLPIKFDYHICYTEDQNNIATSSITDDNITTDEKLCKKDEDKKRITFMNEIHPLYFCTKNGEKEMLVMA